VEARVAAERAQRDATLSKHRTAVQTLGDANKALLARQFGTGAVLPAPAAGSPAQGEGSAQQPALQVSTPEQAVRVLCEATATASVSAMLDRLLPQQAEYRNLADMQAKASRQVSELAQEVAEAHAALEDLRGGGRGTTQAALDAAQARLHEARVAADAAQEVYNQVLQVYVGVRSGMEHLATMLAPLPLPPGQLPVPLSDDTLGDVLAQCQLRLTAALAFVQTMPKAAALLEGILHNPDYAFSATPGS